MKRMDMQTAYAGYGARKVWHKEDRMRLSLPLYSLGEEIFSAVSHGVGALFGAAALVMLLWFCEKSLVNVVSVSIFGGTMILLYTVSTLYHALNVNRAKKVFRVLDHCTIYRHVRGRVGCGGAGHYFKRRRYGEIQGRFDDLLPDDGLGRCTGV